MIIWPIWLVLEPSRTTMDHLAMALTAFAFIFVLALVGYVAVASGRQSSQNEGGDDLP